MSGAIPTASLEYGSANASHLPQLRALMTALHEEHHQRDPDLFKSAAEIDQLKDIASYLNQPECLLFVVSAHVDDQVEVVGFVSGHFCELSSIVSKPVMMGSIDEIYVKPGWRRCGVGQKLINIISQRFKEYGATQLFVEVWNSNTKALETYQKQGFNHHIHWLRKPL